MRKSSTSRSRNGERFGRILAGLLLLALPVLACSFIPQRGDKAATATAEAVYVEQKLGQTLEVERRITAAAQTEQAGQVTATARVREQITATAQAQATQQALATAHAAATATAEANIIATAQAASFLPLVQDLVNRGYLPSTQGSYYRPDNYSQSLASNSGLIVHRMGYSPSAFLVRANIKYEVANSKTGNWFITGCGFAYWDNGQNDYYSIFPALDGFVYARAFMKGRQYRLDQSFYRIPPRPSGSYTATLVAGPRGSYLWIGEDLVKHTIVLDKSMTSGALSFLVASGSEQGYGMRCSFTDVELWVVED